MESDFAKKESLNPNIFSKFFPTNTGNRKGSVTREVETKIFDPYQAPDVIKLINNNKGFEYAPIGSKEKQIPEEIVITVSWAARNVTKLRRFHRVPPLVNSTIEPVQVDHMTKGLRVNGHPWNGVGWYFYTEQVRL